MFETFKHFFLHQKHIYVSSVDFVHGTQGFGSRSGVLACLRIRFSHLSGSGSKFQISPDLVPDQASAPGSRSIKREQSGLKVIY